MEDFLLWLREFSIGTVLIRMALSTLFGSIIGLERSKHGRSAGMRTHIFVSIGAALSSLLGCYMVALDYSSDPARIAAQVISGIGFLGAGIILIQNKTKIVGLTTAAGLWNTAVIGLACGIGFYEGAIVCFAISILANLIFPKIEYWFSKNDAHTMVYMELAESANVNHIYDVLRSSNFGEIHRIDIGAPRSGTNGRSGIVLTITLPKKSNVYSLEKTLCEVEGILFAVEL
ncbi:MAG: MgtC/SapB family protein [Clostridia bacterium]|nr:MgtC/SapB family protein [Clostridia bacterium]